jgi:hypothetical protein
MDTDDIPPALPALGDASTESPLGECLHCYLDRMVDRFGCDGGSRFTDRWRRSQTPPRTELVRWLQANGGFCDCEVIFNVLLSGRGLARHPDLQCPEALRRTVQADDDWPGAWPAD